MKTVWLFSSESCTSTKKTSGQLLSSSGRLFELTIAYILVFAVSLASAKTLICTTSTMDPLSIKACEQLCSIGHCPPYCKCKRIAAKDSCSDQSMPPSKVVSLAENEPAGTSIFSIEVVGQETWTFDLARTEDMDGLVWSDLKSFLAFKRFGKKYEMIVNKTFDLELIFQKHYVQLSTLILNLHCHRPSLPRLSFELFLRVTAVDEFAPQFIGAPYLLSIPEDTTIGTRLIEMDKKTTDRDINPFSNELSRFDIHNYLNTSQRDGQSHFQMENIQTGSIVLKEAVDFEALDSLGSTRFALNVSASDTGGLTTYTEVLVDITDVDDMPPEFLHPGCLRHVTRSRPCPVSFDADVPVGYTGPLLDMRPQEIQARDMDGLDATVTYALYKGPSETKENVDRFSINETTGVLSIGLPFSTPTKVDLVLVATENTTNGFSTQAPLRVTVGKGHWQKVYPTKDNELRNNGSSDVTQISQSADSKDQMLFLIILIVLAAIIMLLILTIVVIIVKLRHPRHATATVHPAGNMAAYDEPSSYHISQEEITPSKAKQSYPNARSPPSYQSRRQTPQEDSERDDNDTQMSSYVLSSGVQPVRKKDLKISQDSTAKEHERLARNNGSRVEDDKTLGNKTTESDDGKVTLSGPSSLKASPQGLQQLSVGSLGDIPAIDVSRDGVIKHDRPNHSPAPRATRRHGNLKGMHAIHGDKQNAIPHASLATRPETDPIKTTVKRDSNVDAHRSTSYYDGKEKKYKNYPRQKLKETHDVEREQAEGISNKFGLPRKIRIPSGVLVMRSSHDRPAAFQSGEDSTASTSSTLVDEPEIDVFCDSRLDSLNEQFLSKAPDENRLNLTERGHEESTTRASKRKMDSRDDASSVPEVSKVIQSIDVVTMGTSTTSPPEPLNAYRIGRAEYESLSRGTIHDRLATPNGDDKPRIKPESDNITNDKIRRKKKRRRFLVRNADAPVTSGSKSLGNDQSRSQQQPKTPSSRLAKHCQEDAGRLNSDSHGSSSGLDS